MLLNDIWTEERLQNSRKQNGISVAVGADEQEKVVKIRLDGDGILVVGESGTGKSVLQCGIIYSTAYVYKSENVTFQIVDMSERKSEYEQYYGDADSLKALKITKLATGISTQELLNYLDKVEQDIARRLALFEGSGTHTCDEYNAKVVDSDKIEFVNICLVDINFADGATVGQFEQVGDKLTTIQQIGAKCGYNVIIFEQDLPRYFRFQFNMTDFAHIIAFRKKRQIDGFSKLGFVPLDKLKNGAGDGYLYSSKSHEVVKLNAFDMSDELTRFRLLNRIKA